jgi:hypothetical protein
MMIVLIILILLLFLLYPIGFTKKSIFLSSFVNNQSMEISEEDVFMDTLKYKDSNRPIYYDFVPEVKPML